MNRPQHWDAWLVMALGLGLCAISVLIALRQPARQLDAVRSSDTPNVPVLVRDGTALLAPNDWEAVGKVSALQVSVPTFSIDTTEVTRQAWARCVAQGKCQAVVGSSEAEGQIPVTHVTALQAQQYCETREGRLPKRSEWVLAAASSQGHRYPWGQTGLVCRRAVFGMVEGPCAVGHDRPLPVGSRQAGSTLNGIYDLSGNVAEWVIDEEDGFKAVAVGGSFRSTLAGQLKVWAREEALTARADIGFRCVYPHQ